MAIVTQKKFQDGSSVTVRSQKSVRKLYICWKRNLLSVHKDLHKVKKLPPLSKNHPQLYAKIDNLLPPPLFVDVINE